MEPKIKSVHKHWGLPLPPPNNRCRTPGYWIGGKGFGDDIGEVEILNADDNETRSPRIKCWSNKIIVIPAPACEPWGEGIWGNVLFVTTADGRRSKPFELIPLVRQFGRTG